MTATADDDPTASERGDRERVLVLVGNDRNRELVTEVLASDYDVGTARPDAEWEPFDLCVVGAEWFRDVREGLAAHRAAAAGNLPVLLLVLERDEERAVRVLTDDGPVDDVVSVPTSPGVLRARAESLLRTRRLSRDLAAERERYRALTESASDAIVTVDTDGVVHYANPAVEQLFGHAPEDLVGEPLTTLIPEDRREAHEAAFAAYCETGERTLDWTGIEFEALHADGHEVPVEVSFAEYETAGGRRFTGIIRDVTERKELEADLREETELLERLFDTSPVAVTVLDTDGNIVRANEAAQDVLRLEPSELAARQFDSPEWAIFDAEGEPVPPEDLPFARVMATGEPVFDYQHGIRALDGEEVWLSINAAPLTDEDGEIEGVVAAMKDITELKDRERDLRQTADAFRDLYRVAATDRPFEEKLREMLDLGADYLDVEVGFLTRVEGGDASGTGAEDGTGESATAGADPDPDARTQTIVEARGDHELLRPGESVPLSRSYCRKTIAAGGRFVVRDALAAGWAEDPAYETFGLGFYVGSNVSVDGDLYGTLAFADRDPRAEPFDQRERALVDLVAQWAAFALERREREADLERALGLLDRAEELADVGAWKFDPRTEEAFFSDEFLRIHGLDDRPPDEVELDDVLALYRPDDRERVVETYRQAVETGDPFEVEFRMTTPDGVEKWLRGYAAPVVENGEVVRVEGATQDVTWRKEQELELERAFGLLDAGQQLANVGAWEYDIAADETSWTDQVYEIHGVDEDYDPDFETVIETFYTDEARVYAAYEEILETGEPLEREFELVTPDGEQKWVHIHVDPLLEDGEVVILRGAVQDITERKERELELGRERTRLDLALSASRAGVWENDLASNEIVWDERTERLFGLDSGEFDGDRETFTDLVHPEDLSRLREAREAAIRTGGTFAVEYRIQRSDGETRWIEGHGTVVTDEQDDAGRIIGIVRDITERKERELELGRTVDLYDRTQTIADIGGWEVDPETGEVLWTTGVYEILGVEHGPEPPLEEALEFYPPEDREVVADAIERASETGESFDVEVQVERTDGKRRWVRVRGEARQREGEAPLLRGIFQDITERKERELELERYETIVRTATNPIKATDADGRFTMVNDRFAELTGYDREELLGADASLVFGDERMAEVEERIRDLLAAGERETTYETRVRAADGTVREYLTSLSLLFEDGEFAGTVSVDHDITDLREHERRLSVLDRVLRHNIRNKMNIVLAQARQLAEARNDTVGATAETIADASERLLELSEQARRFQGSIRPGHDSTPIDASAVVRDIVEEARMAYPDADIALDVPAEAWVRAHETFDLAVDELVENAIKHADRDPDVAVTVRDRPDADTVEVRVGDNGPGLSEMERGVFLRGRESQMEHLTGLGLWLVRWTVTASGGSIDIEDNDPRGQVVVIRLPRAEPAPDGTFDREGSQDAADDAGGQDG